MQILSFWLALSSSTQPFSGSGRIKPGTSMEKLSSTPAGTQTLGRVSASCSSRQPFKSCCAQARFWPCLSLEKSFQKSPSAKHTELLSRKESSILSSPGSHVMAGCNPKIKQNSPHTACPVTPFFKSKAKQKHLLTFRKL